MIGKSRLSEAEYLEGFEKEWTAEPGPGDKPALDPARATDPEAWLHDQVRLWFGELHTAESPGGWAVALGDRLKQHAAFQELLMALGGHTVDWDRLVAQLSRQRSDWRRDPELASLSLASLLGLVSAARAWRDEVPELAARREAAGEPRPVQPFLDVRLQLWQRELRRMVASVGEHPRLRHSMDLNRETRRQHLPLVHCRECGAMGWATLVQRDKPHLMRTDLDSFYRAFFGRDSRVKFLFPSAAVPPEDPTWKHPAFRLDTESLTKVEEDDEPDSPVIEVTPSASVRSTARGPELSRDCPLCMSRDSLTIIGFRAATLTSVYIDQVFASPFNNDKKLLTFSDSVQDAAHRAGFFGARTWRTNLRIALYQVIRDREGLTLAELADSLGRAWRSRMDAATWVATFLAPNMTWLHEWGQLKATGEIPGDSNLEELIGRRLAYETCTEFGLQAGIGRSLPRTGTATVALDAERLERAVEALIEPLRNEVPGLREVGSQAVRHFVVGLLHYLRTRGGILARSLPGPYVETCGRDDHAFKRDIALPAFGPTSRLPALLTDRPRSRFETWTGRSETSWYARWVGCCLSAGQTLAADAARLAVGQGPRRSRADQKAQGDRGQGRRPRAGARPARIRERGLARAGGRDQPAPYPGVPDRRGAAAELRLSRVGGAPALGDLAQKEEGPQQGQSVRDLELRVPSLAASALSELAPRSDFYAGGRRVRIDQVDVAVSEIEEWRFCTECNHAQRIDAGDEATACPACDSAGWRDDGQKFRLLKLQQVFANAPDRESRIRDDKDERQPRFFQRQILVDIKDEDRAGAWRVDDDRLPFGFELLERATFREVNFGEPTDQGRKSIIAGREAVRPGFMLCARCGKVQQPNRDPEHALSCPSHKEGARPQIEPCLYLYRAFTSEALRLLLPMTDLGTTRQLNSFVAALQAGLKLRFGGSVDHLRTTVYSDPVADSTLRKQYLVIFDTVPGGTGYLKQLVTPGTEGGEMPLFEAMELARQRIEGCVCWNDPDRDGCYRCLYAYRNARDMGDTSAQVASDLLRRILAGRGKLERIKSLGDVSISGLMDSVLEVRFTEALRWITDKAGRAAKLKPAVVSQKPGYRWTLGEAEWVVELQVQPPVSESGGVPVSIDFVMRPARARSERKLAIFLDGWTFHKQRIGKDLRQRMALLASGNWDVWTFTWADLDAKLSASSTADVPELAVPDAGNLKVMLQQMGLADHSGIASRSAFAWLEAELIGDGLRWTELAKGVLAARMRHARPADAERWTRFVNRVAPPVARAGLEAMAPKLFSEDRAETNPFFELMAVHDGSDAALLCTLDDREENHEAAEFKAGWHGYLRLFQLLRRAPNAWFMTRTGTTEGTEYEPIAAMLHGLPEETAWHHASEIEPGYQRLAQRLMEAGVKEPEIGMEIPDRRGETWAEAELLWEQERVAVTSRAGSGDALSEPASDWVVLFLEDLADDPAPVIEALRRSEEK